MSLYKKLIYKLYATARVILTVVFLCVVGLVHSQFGGKTDKVSVSGSTLADGDYPTLKVAFDAINNHDQSKNTIDIVINGNTIETSTAQLNAGTWEQLTISPSGVSSITGSLAGPLIDLNGADNVTIDGQGGIEGAKNLTITNTSTSSAAGTSTIRFINDASNNTVQYCIVKGSETNTASGIIFFSTTTGANGNDRNTINSNNIFCYVPSSPPVNAIYSAGTSAKANDHITISNNNFSGFLNSAIVSNGIAFASNTTDCAIFNNSFYSATDLYPSEDVAYTVIRVDNSLSCSGFTITDNFIGGTQPLCGGSGFYKTGTANNEFAAIYLNAATTKKNSIQNNTIKNFSCGNKNDASWTCINIVSGDADVGTLNGNGIESIPFSSVNSAVNFYGIRISSPGTVNCQNNVIQSICLGNGKYTAHNFYGIYKSASVGETTISNNRIGSLIVENDIYDTPQKLDMKLR